MMTALLGVFVMGCATGIKHKDAKIYEPEFLTPKLKKQNLLGNPSFEEADSPAWVLGSWRQNKNAGRVLQFKSKDGKQIACAEIDTTQDDIVNFEQIVRVKPKTK